MILRELPNLSDERFCQHFYARWGRENCVVTGRTNFAEYPPYRQTLSIKAAFGGSESYLIERRRIVVDDDAYLILNADETYGSLIDSHTPVESFALFFRPGMDREVYSGLVTSIDTPYAEMDQPRKGPVAFAQHLQYHDEIVSPVLRFIRRHIQHGMDDEMWLEEQMQFLLMRLLRRHRLAAERSRHIQALKSSTRQELLRRVGHATDYILSHYDLPLNLHAMAQAANISPFHFLRVFQQIHALTPSRFLERKRVAVAARLVRSTDLPIADIAVRVGLESRSTLLRAWARVRADRPSTLRRDEQSGQDARLTH
jgi:AraC-like DNA-binding protein